MTTERSSGAVPFVLLLFLAGTAFLSLLLAGWGRGGDALVDAGREIYLPWQVAGGKVLYRDLAHLFGPVSVYWNALLFSLFGSSLAVLHGANAVLLALFSVLVFALAREWIGRSLALVPIILFYLLLAFSHVDRLGNFNYITPYSTELVQGIYLSVLSLFTAKLFAERGQPWLAGLLGVLAGVVFLLKSEVFFALVSAEAVFLPLLFFSWPGTRRPVFKSLSFFLLGWAVFPVLAAVYFAWRMPAGDAVRGLLFMYLAPLRQTAEMKAYYGQMFGTKELASNLAEAGRSLCVNGFAFASAIVCARLTFDSARPLWRYASILFALVSFGGLILAFLDYDKIIFYTLPRAWPFLLILGLGYALYRYAKSDGPKRALLAWIIGCIVFCDLLFAKTYLAVVFTYYGGFFTLPAFLLLFVFSVALVSRHARSRAARNVATAYIIAFFCIAASFATKHTLLAYRAKARTLNGVNDAIHMADPSSLQPILDELAYRAAPSDTLAVLPEGVMMNYLANLGSSTKYSVVMPFEWNLYGGKNMVGDVAAHPPDWILLLKRSLREYGHTCLGGSYGRELTDWIDANYSVVRTFGDGPFGPGGFGAALLRHRGWPPPSEAAGMPFGAGRGGYP